MRGLPGAAGPRWARPMPGRRPRSTCCPASSGPAARRPTPPRSPRPGERLPDAFAARAARTPDAPAVLGTGGALSYGELLARARAAAGWLRGAGRTRCRPGRAGRPDHAPRAGADRRHPGRAAGRRRLPAGRRRAARRADRGTCCATAGCAACSPTPAGPAAATGDRDGPAWTSWSCDATGPVPAPRTRRRPPVPAPARTTWPTCSTPPAPPASPRASWSATAAWPTWWPTATPGSASAPTDRFFGRQRVQLRPVGVRRLRRAVGRRRAGAARRRAGRRPRALARPVRPVRRHGVELGPGHRRADAGAGGSGSPGLDHPGPDGARGSPPAAGHAERRPHPARPAAGRWPGSRTTWPWSRWAARPRPRSGTSCTRSARPSWAGPSRTAGPTPTTAPTSWTPTAWTRRTG